MVSKIRAQKIADRMFEELSTILLMETSDPRLETVNLTHVRVDKELAFADVYVSSLEGKEVADEILAALQHAAGFLRSELARRMSIRYMPRLRFHWDISPEHADHIDRLIASLHAGESNPEDEEIHTKNDFDE
ncbi:MAG: 30S ribosome-binding factor RbfA [Anaerolineales bacterium]|nr:30S ribosome-binding factor RbfA [Anaerolineales bacterium]